MKAIHQKEKESTALNRSKLLSIIPRELFKPNVKKYVLDMILSSLTSQLMILGACKILSLTESSISPYWVYSAGLVMCILAAFPTYKSCLFIHEAVHQIPNMPFIAWFYNLVNGFVNRMPFYAYTPHLRHHMPENYGTLQDPEYDYLASYSVAFNFVVAPIVSSFASAVFVFIRFGLIPFLLPFVGSSARNFIFRFASTLVMNPKYDRGLPMNQTERWNWYSQDFGCAVWTCLLMMALHWNWIGVNYLLVNFMVTFCTFLVNYYRAIMAHRYFADGRCTFTRKQMILDSVNYENDSFWSEMFFPFSLNYHGLHHVFPNIPYHSLKKVHSIIMEYIEKQDPNHPYKYTVVKSYWNAVALQANGEM
ncbi:hypothetical protein C9374_010834 [Naegleria lovaniensis]|uniref:Fatty acid desaturase domain-containing protein n=1 Tax=Naegleria lovaniensis TaxID=51637 RepID=A0AA88GGP5_NAELO|nr:uncharacterized protein C9374_010834 [Naegleria lovaniensis]KAG2374264.1 hypothetical protein C9374_010834 [Naegleria lovaniensis]